jgi:hypothetical protein
MREGKGFEEAGSDLSLKTPEFSIKDDLTQLPDVLFSPQNLFTTGNR